MRRSSLQSVTQITPMKPGLTDFHFMRCPIIYMSDAKAVRHLVKVLIINAYSRHGLTHLFNMGPWYSGELYACEVCDLVFLYRGFATVFRSLCNQLHLGAHALMVVIYARVGNAVHCARQVARVRVDGR